MINIIIVILVITLLLFIPGLILYAFPPKQINSVIGYRTKRSMKTQESWDLANKFVGKLMMVFGAIYLILFGLFYLAFFRASFMTDNENTITFICVSLFVIFFITIIILVERKLKKTFI